jgi:hypothetical protein
MELFFPPRHPHSIVLIHGGALFLRMFYFCFFLLSPAERFIRIEDFAGQVVAYGFGRLYEKLPFFAGMKRRQAEYTLSQSKLCPCAVPRLTCAIGQMLHALCSI